MKPQGLLIAVALLAVLGGAIWYSNKQQAASAAKTPATNETKILSIPEDQIQAIKIQHANGDVVELSKASGKWRLVQPKDLGADPDASSSLVSALTSVTADKTIEDKATDVAPYGLTHPALDVTVSRKDGKTNEILIGDDTPNNSGAYAKLPNDAHVYTVFSFVKTSLDKSLNDLRDKRLLTFDSDKLTRVELTAKGQSVEFGKNGQNEWEILKPRPLRADSSTVDSLVTKLKDAKMDATVSADDAKKAVGRFRLGNEGRHRVALAIRAARRPSRSGKIKIRITTRRARPSRASIRLPPMLATRSTRASTISAIRSSSISASATPPSSKSTAPFTPRPAISGCPARRPWTTLQRAESHRQAARSERHQVRRKGRGRPGLRSHRHLQ